MVAWMLIMFASLLAFYAGLWLSSAKDRTRHSVGIKIAIAGLLALAFSMWKFVTA